MQRKTQTSVILGNQKPPLVLTVPGAKGDKWELRGDFMATDKPRFSATFTDDSLSKIQKNKKDNDMGVCDKSDFE